MRTVDKACGKCGVMMYGVTSRKRVCPECKRKHDMERQKEYRAKYKQQAAEAAAAPQEKPQEKLREVSQLEKDVREAQRCGLSYGQLKLRALLG